MVVPQLKMSPLLKKSAWMSLLKVNISQSFRDVLVGGSGPNGDKIFVFKFVSLLNKTLWMSYFID